MAWPFSRKIAVKENPVGGSFMVPGGQAWQRPTSKRAYIEEGYQLNVVVYRSVREITRALSDLEIEVVGPNGDIIEKHPVLDMLSRPNPTQGFDSWITEAFTNYMLTGEMAILRYPEAGQPSELWNANPLNITVIPGRGGLASAYVHDLGNQKKTFPVMYPSGACQMFWAKMYDPLDYWRGQSPLVAAGLAADTHNAGMRWNYSLLRNSARPSGLVKLTGDAGGEVIARLKEWFRAAFQGEHKAGEIPVLPAGADWVAMDNTARDMDFMSTQKEAAKLIASAFGVPLPLIDNDASTFNNVEQAKERFYSDTILPMFREFLAQFGAWLLPLYGKGLKFQVNEDAIGALEAVRTRLFERMVKAYQADLLTRDEAREALGYDPLGEDVTQEDVATAVKLLAYSDKQTAPDADELAVVVKDNFGGGIETH